MYNRLLLLLLLMMRRRSTIGLTGICALLISRLLRSWRPAIILIPLLLIRRLHGGRCRTDGRVRRRLLIRDIEG